jgi:hypothetical protein
MKKKPPTRLLLVTALLAAAALLSRQPVRANSCAPRPSGLLRVVTVSEGGGATTADYAGFVRLTSANQGVVELVVNTSGGTYTETYRVSSAATH